jgi:hypothetical protein
MGRAAPVVAGVLQGIGFGVCMEYLPPVDDHESPSLFGIGFLTRWADGEQSYFWIPTAIALLVLSVRLIRRRRKGTVAVESR